MKQRSNLKTSVAMRANLYCSLRRGWWALKKYRAQEIGSLLQKSQWWPREQLEAFQAQKLGSLIEHCYYHVPYYRRVLDDRSVKPTDIKKVSDLAMLPILTKDIVRANWNELRADNIAPSDSFIATTGGSTGEPMRILKARKDEAWSSMCFERGLSWGGLFPGMRRIVLTGGSVGTSHKNGWQRIVGKLGGQIHLLAYDLTKHNLREYVEVIERSGAKFLLGYANNIYHLARLLLDRGGQLKLDGVFTTAERILPSWSHTIRKGMNCKLYSYYGCGESNSLAYQCQEGDAYHISEEHVVVEVQGEPSPRSGTRSGRVLLTDLDNYAMPLLRYENGDYMSLGDTPCSCGRSLSLISKLTGRTYEFLYDTSRGLVSAGICDVILGNVTSIAEFQVRQREFDRILVFVVPLRPLGDSDKTFIRKSFCHYLGKSMNVEIKLVSEIRRTKAQKLQTAINELLLP